MKKWYKNIILILTWTISINGYSQINCTVPIEPLLTNVSVQPETGYTDLSWELSPSTDIAAYILYTYENGDGMAFDTIWDPTATNYTVINTAPKYLSTSYVAAAYRLPIIPGMDGCPSPLSNVLNTIFTEAFIDTCNRKIAISWNSYASYPYKVTDYSILLSIDGGTFSETARLSPGSTNYIINDFTTDAEYCFVVRANLEGGEFSTSNKICLLTTMQSPPGWINADYATVNSDNTISVVFTIDPISEITHFRLEKKTGTSDNFEVIAQLFSDNFSIFFIDDQADVNIINYYRLIAINNCNYPIKISNISSNIVLALENTDNDLNLSWNSYAEWLGDISSYRLFINTGEGFEEKMVFQPTETQFKLTYQDIMYEVSGKEVCFYITANESSNPYGIAGNSSSNIVCKIPTEIITVPNLFTPNNDLVNDYFKPVLSFTPRDYYLVISSRQGNILFETRDYNTSWDGSQNGNGYLQGVYLWFLKVTTPSGKSISRTGTITIINNRQ